MLCRKCNLQIAEDSKYCNYCGVNQQLPERSVKRRGNSQGTVYKDKNGTWKAEITLGYEKEVIDGKIKYLRKKATKTGFKTKKEALDYLPQLRITISEIDINITFTNLYKEWLPFYEQKVTKDTIDCYKSAYKHLSALYYVPFRQIKTEHLQQCIDQCEKGRRTKENMKALAGLLYKYAQQKDIVDKNYAQFIYIPKTDKKEKVTFSKEEQGLLWDNSQIKGIDLILVLCYTGLRPGELLAAETKNYHPEEDYFIAGSKTTAGKDRIITISPKIKPFFSSFAKGEYLFSYDGKKLNEKQFREKLFYPALEACGIDIGETGNRRITPHCCRHTFATLMKEIQAPTTDKQRLIGHSKFEMTAYYTHTDIDSLKKITDQL